MKEGGTHENEKYEYKFKVKNSLWYAADFMVPLPPEVWWKPLNDRLAEQVSGERDFLTGIGGSMAMKIQRRWKIGLAASALLLTGDGEPRFVLPTDVSCH